MIGVVTAWEIVHIESTREIMVGKLYIVVWVWVLQSKNDFIHFILSMINRAIPCRYRYYEWISSWCLYISWSWCYFILRDKVCVFEICYFSKCRVRTFLSLLLLVKPLLQKEFIVLVSSPYPIESLVWFCSALYVGFKIFLEWIGSILILLLLVIEPEWLSFSFQMSLS